MSNSEDVTQILSRLGQGDDRAVDELFPLVYQELRAIARRKLKGERPGHTLQATALTHEAYLKMLGDLEVEWKNRVHFYAIAARAMRQILVDHARAKQRKKRGGDWQRVTLDPSIIGESNQPLDLIALDAALEKLAGVDPRKARVVELLYFGGLNVNEVADALEISSRTVERDWRFSRLWLLRELQTEAGDAGRPDPRN
jgi:RNA polymerase sigma factor (TIGR02999 family)